MRCIDCPLYKFDGNTFSCAGIPYHNFGEEGMFADLKQEPEKNGLCTYANIRIVSIEHMLARTREQLKDVYDDIAICKMVLNIVTPKSERWYAEFRKRLVEAESTAGGLECLEEKLKEEKSMIVSPLESLSNL